MIYGAELWINNDMTIRFRAIILLGLAVAAMLPGKVALPKWKYHVVGVPITYNLKI